MRGDNGRKGTSAGRNAGSIRDGWDGRPWRGDAPTICASLRERGKKGTPLKGDQSREGDHY